jgi:pyridinium-3,5-biscarboxylic acid mononucleotide sulfurtransferase
MTDFGVKYTNLQNYIKGLGKVAVAFSGGVDSTFLLKTAQLALGSNVLAISVKTPYIPGWEMEEAVHFARSQNIRHKVFEYPFLNPLKDNPKDRCYTCKYHLFKFMANEIAKDGYTVLLDGTNFDDLKEYRPGLQALRDLKIQSPLLEFKFTKDEIRKLSAKLDLPTANKPAYACLLTRIPYNTEVTISDLRRIELAEKFLHGLGFHGARVRAHGSLARIEVQKEDLPKMINLDLFRKISLELKAIGYTFVSLDMDGYRTGSYNEEI